MRLFVLVLAAVLLVSTVAQAEMNPRRRHIHCRYESRDGNRGFTDPEVKALIGCAVDHFPTSLSTALYVANRESGYECKANNPISSAGGVYQMLDSTWAAWYPRHVPYLNRHGYKVRGSRYACRINVLVAIREAHQGGWTPWAL